MKREKKTESVVETVKETEPTRIEAVRAAAAKLTAIHRKMTCLTKLTPEQRAEQIGRGTGIGAKKLRLLQNRLETAQGNKALLPSSFDLPKLEHDAVLTAALVELAAVVTKISNDVNDTLREVGYRAVVDAETANTYAKVASKRIQRLKPTEHGRKSRSSGTTGPPEVVPAPAQPAGPAVTPNVAVDPTKKAA